MDKDVLFAIIVGLLITAVMLPVTYLVVSALLIP